MLLSLVFISFNLRGQVDSSRKNQLPTNLIEIETRTSGQLFSQSSNSQLAAIGAYLLSSYLFNQAGEVSQAAQTDKTIDPADNYFVAGTVLMVGIGFEISYISRYRKAGKQLRIEQERQKLEKENLERRIRDLENKINKG